MTTTDLTRGSVMTGDRSVPLAAPSPVMMLERANDNLSAALQYPSDAQHVMRCVEVARELISHVIVASSADA